MDIIANLRFQSSTNLKHMAVKLTADNRCLLCVPERLACGYLIFKDGTETSHQVGEFYDPGIEGGRDCGSSSEDFESHYTRLKQARCLLEEGLLGRRFRWRGTPRGT